MGYLPEVREVDQHIKMAPNSASNAPLVNKHSLLFEDTLEHAAIGGTTIRTVKGPGIQVPSKASLFKNVWYRKFSTSPCVLSLLVLNEQLEVRV